MKEQFPNTIDEPNVWTAANFGLEEEWLVQLSADNISEIERAMDSVLASGIPPQKIHSDIFYYLNSHQSYWKPIVRLNTGVGS